MSMQLMPGRNDFFGLRIVGSVPPKLPDYIIHPGRGGVAEFANRPVVAESSPNPFSFSRDG